MNVVAACMFTRTCFSIAGRLTLEDFQSVFQETLPLSSSQAVFRALDKVFEHVYDV